MNNKLKDKIKINLKNYFSNGPKAAFIVVLILLCITSVMFGMRKTVKIVVDGKEQTIKTYRITLKEALKSNDIILGPKDKVKPGLDTKLKNGEKIYVKRAVKVKVNVDGKNLSIDSAEDNVEDMLSSEKISVKEFDKVSPSREAPLKNGMKVVVTRVETKLIKENKTIECPTVVKNDDNLTKGTRKIIQQGSNGEKEVAVRVVYENGKEVTRKVVSEIVKKKPVEKIVAMGTLGVVRLSRGSSAYYKSSMNMVATAYSSGYNSTGKSPGHPAYGITATGARAVRNSGGYSSVAVDPRVIPLGTKLYIEGYGYAIAQDTGGAIKGNRIDLYFDSEQEAYNWGIKNIKVYILK